MNDLPTPPLPPGLPALPEPPAGLRWEYRGWAWMSAAANNYIRANVGDTEWQGPFDGGAFGYPTHYAELVPAPPEVEAIADEFRGDSANLRASIKALIEMNDDGCLVPHGIGGHARALLAASYHRLEQTATQAAEIERLKAKVAGGWNPLDSAPHDGTVIDGLYSSGPCLIRWNSEQRQCMLAGVGGGNGSFGPGWEDDYNHLIVDEPMAWREADYVDADLLEARADLSAARAALQQFADPTNWRQGAKFDPNSHAFEGTSVAEEGLALAQSGRAEAKHIEPTKDELIALGALPGFYGREAHRPSLMRDMVLTAMRGKPETPAR